MPLSFLPSNNKLQNCVSVDSKSTDTHTTQAALEVALHRRKLNELRLEFLNADISNENKTENLNIVSNQSDFNFIYPQSFNQFKSVYLSRRKQENINFNNDERVLIHPIDQFSSPDISLSVTKPVSVEVASTPSFNYLFIKSNSPIVRYVSKSCSSCADQVTVSKIVENVCLSSSNNSNESDKSTFKEQNDYIIRNDEINRFATSYTISNLEQLKVLSDKCNAYPDLSSIRNKALYPKPNDESFSSNVDFQTTNTSDSLSTYDSFWHCNLEKNQHQLKAEWLNLSPKQNKHNFNLVTLPQARLVHNPVYIASNCFEKLDLTKSNASSHCLNESEPVYFKQEQKQKIELEQSDLENINCSLKRFNKNVLNNESLIKLDELNLSSLQYTLKGTYKSFVDEGNMSYETSFSSLTPSSLCFGDSSIVDVRSLENNFNQLDKKLVNDNIQKTNRNNQLVLSKQSKVSNEGFDQSMGFVRDEPISSPYTNKLHRTCSTTFASSDQIYANLLMSRLSLKKVGLILFWNIYT